MYCTSCGKPIDDDSNYCPFCGVSISANNSQVQDDGIPEDIPFFTAPSGGPTCYYHKEEPGVGQCARCGKILCRDCCESYGVSVGQYAGHHLCYDCTRQLVEEDVEEFTGNLNKIKGQFLLQLIGMVLGFIVFMGGGIEAAFIGACIGGVFLSAVKAFFVLLLEAIEIALSGNFGVFTIFSLIFNIIVIVAKCVWVSVKQTIQYIVYIRRTSGVIENDREFLKRIEEYMEYTRIRQRNREADLKTLMQEHSELKYNSYARMVRDQGEREAENYVHQCVARIAENGEIIRDFPSLA